MSFMIQLSTSNRRKESRYRTVYGCTCTSSCLQSNTARGMLGGGRGGGPYISYHEQSMYSTWLSIHWRERLLGSCYVLFVPATGYRCLLTGSINNNPSEVLSKTSVVDPDPGRIGYILADPNPYSFQPNVKLNYTYFH
jgi:hypothetical protein